MENLGLGNNIFEVMGTFWSFQTPVAAFVQVIHTCVLQTVNVDVAVPVRGMLAVAGGLCWEQSSWGGASREFSRYLGFSWVKSSHHQGMQAEKGLRGHKTKIPNPANYSQVQLNASTYAGVCQGYEAVTPSLIKIIHLLSVLVLLASAIRIAVSSRSTSLHRCVQRCFPRSCCKMVLQNREMWLCQSGWVSEPGCAAGIAAGGQGLPCKVCAGGCERVQRCRGKNPVCLRVGLWVHRTCTDSSCPEKTDSLVIPPSPVCTADVGVEYGIRKYRWKFFICLCHIAVLFSLSCTGEGLVCICVIKTADIIRF